MFDFETLKVKSLFFSVHDPEITNAVHNWALSW